MGHSIRGRTPFTRAGAEVTSVLIVTLTWNQPMRKICDSTRPGSRNSPHHLRMSENQHPFSPRTKRRASNPHIRGAGAAIDPPQLVNGAQPLVSMAEPRRALGLYGPDHGAGILDYLRLRMNGQSNIDLPRLTSNERVSHRCYLSS